MRRNSLRRPGMLRNAGLASRRHDGRDPQPTGEVHGALELLRSPTAKRHGGFECQCGVETPRSARGTRAAAGSNELGSALSKDLTAVTARNEVQGC